MKKALIALAAAIGVLVIAVIVVPFLIPTGTWKSQIEERVSAATGRKLTIAGPVHLSLLPAVAFVANDVTLANAPGARDATMATIGKLEVRVRLLPLLSGTLAIDRFVVEKPVVHLEVNRQGQPNWDFGGTEQPAPAQPPARSTGSPSAGGGSSAASVALSDVRMSDGTVTYWDARSGTSYDVSNIDARLSFPDIDHPFKFDGSLVWNGQKVALTAEVTNPRALTGGGRSAVGLGFRSASLAGVLKGTASGVSPVKFDGTLSVTSPSVRNLIAWMGKTPPAPGSGLGPLSISGKLAADGAKIAFTDATYKLDALEAKGDLSVDDTGRVPYVKATLATNVLDLNPYLASTAKPAPSSGKAAPKKAPASPAQGWSTEPIDVSALKAANADLALTADGLIVHDIKLGKSALGVSLKNGKLTTDLKELALYQGTGHGSLSIDGSGSVPATALDLHLNNVQAEPLLKDTMGLDAVRGTAVADVTLSATGASQRDLISALDGKGAIKLRNGAIRGFDLGAMLRNIGDAFSSAKGGGNDETTFADASATFTITKGLARNDDLLLQAPFFRATGKGTANLLERTVNYRVEPKVVASGSGQHGSKDAVGVAVPVVIKGRWDKLSYEPDIASMLSVDPKGTVKGILNMFRGGSKSGSSGGGQPSGGAQPTPANPLDKLKNLFGR